MFKKMSFSRRWETSFLVVLLVVMFLLSGCAFLGLERCPDKQYLFCEDSIIPASTGIHECIPFKTHWEIHKFKDPDGSIGKALKNGASLEQFADARYAIETIEHNIALQEGITELLGLTAGIGSPIAWSNAAAYLGVGDTATAENATHTGLQAPTNKLYVDMDATYPQIVSVGTGSNNALEWRSTFASAEANFAWEEYSVSNTSSDTGKNLNRKISAKGTKVAGESWTLSLKICAGTECT